MSIRHGLIAALAAGALTLSACGQSENEASAEPDPASDEASAEQSSEQDGEDVDDDPQEESNSEGAGGADSAAEPAAGGADLTFSATTLAGAEFDGEQLAGKPSVLWFWAPWCPTCRAQAPAVSEIAKKYDGEVNVVGVGGAAATSEIEGVAVDIDGPTHLIDEPGAVWQHFNITAQSTYVILDADGQVVTDGEFLSDDQLRQTVADITG